MCGCDIDVLCTRENEIVYNASTFRSMCDASLYSTVCSRVCLSSLFPIRISHSFRVARSVTMMHHIF